MKRTLLALGVSALVVTSFSVSVAHATVVWSNFETRGGAESNWSGPAISNAGTDFINNSTWTYTPTSSGSIASLQYLLKYVQSGTPTPRTMFVVVTQGSETTQSAYVSTSWFPNNIETTTTFSLSETFNFVSGTPITFLFKGFEDSFPIADPSEGNYMSVTMVQKNGRPSQAGVYKVQQQQDNDPEYEYINSYDVIPFQSWEGTWTGSSSGTHDATLDAYLPTVGWGFDTGGGNTTTTSQDAMNRRLGLATSTFPMCIIYSWSGLFDAIIGPTSGSPNPQTLELTTHVGDPQTLTIDLRNGVGASDPAYQSFTSTIGNWFLGFLWFGFGTFIMVDLFLMKRMNKEDDV